MRVKENNELFLDTDKSHFWRLNLKTLPFPENLTSVVLRSFPHCDTWNPACQAGKKPRGGPGPTLQFYQKENWGSQRFPLLTVYWLAHEATQRTSPSLLGPQDITHLVGASFTLWFELWVHVLHDVPLYSDNPLITHLSYWSWHIQRLSQSQCSVNIRKWMNQSRNESISISMNKLMNECSGCAIYQQENNCL